MKTLLIILASLSAHTALVSNKVILVDEIPFSVSVSQFSSTVLVYGLPRLVRKAGAECGNSWLIIKDVKTNRTYHACFEKKKINKE